ncbi:hypothetical protein SAMN04487983_102765 [Streptomyces sp. yr375]|uniref:hypothetical protein n=1 Tax=Streptomyces sp. yr375 TaxID=1761906 RepID=UPI0008AD73F4|nr:hypothetical protein [Streptomyces sp. yr375]SES00736.1 hypothetical protein SAMN04487983_102765 [Streptomyces sp. yr375]
MTADAEQLRQDGHRIEKWSIGWMLLSLAMWAWFGYRFLLDEDRGLFAPAQGGRALVGILALAVIPTIITAATLVYARVLFRLARRTGAEAG